LLDSPNLIFELGDLELACGGVLHGAQLVYTTHGTLNEAGDNAILYPHMYSGTPSSLESTIQAGRALDPESWFVVCPGQLGNGQSSSPSNTDGDFPEVTIADDVAAQRRLVESLGIERLALALGFSMGAQQAYEYAVRDPEGVARLAAIGGTARTTAHNAACVLVAEEALRDGDLRAHAHAWVPVGLSHELLRTDGWRASGYASVDDLVTRLFEDDFATMDARNLACQCRKWRFADVSQTFAGDLAAALGRIEARTFVLPFSHDLLFPVEDCAAEQRLVPDSELRVIESPWGHWAWEMTPGFSSQLDGHLRDLLSG
jgi:homoserine O-acetyltransferase/O-succinyltransferase